MADHYNNDNNGNNGNNRGNGHTTEYCVLCRRPDTSAGRMIHLPGNMCVCSDCMQKMMDFAGKMDLSNMTGDPNMLQGLFNMFGNPLQGAPSAPASPDAAGTGPSAAQKAKDAAVAFRTSGRMSPPFLAISAENGNMANAKVM